MPDGTEAKVEILADGQQFVADGIHPDTGLPYLWPAGSPETVPLDQVPPITLEQAQAIVAKARELLVANGGVEKKPPPRGSSRTTGAAGADSFFAKVNAAALGNLAAWVKALFRSAEYQLGTGAWRVTAQGSRAGQTSRRTSRSIPRASRTSAASTASPRSMR